MTKKDELQQSIIHQEAETQSNILAWVINVLTVLSLALLELNFHCVASHKLIPITTIIMNLTYTRYTVIIGVFAHCAVVFLNVFVLRFLSHRGAETPICAKLPIPVRKLNYITWF